MVTTNDRRRMLEDAWDAAPEGALTLREQLRTNERAAGLLVKHGSVASVNKNSGGHSYANGGPNMTTTETANTWRDLIDLYDRLVLAYTTASLATDDDTIYAEMKRRLVPINAFTNDFTGVCH